jgi:hypothetical protein
VFDTNTWLNLYTYSDSVAVDFRKLQDNFAKQIFIPFRVVEEFMAKRLNRINEAITKKADLSDKLGNMLGDLRSLKEHQILSDDLIENQIAKAFNETKRKLKTQIEALETFGSADIYTFLFMEQFKANVGEPFELTKDHAEKGLERLKLGLPPGDKDDERPDKERLGDYIIWQEILIEGAKRETPLIFVTADGTSKKKQGWFSKSGKISEGANPFLVKEYSDATGKRCIFYTPEDFMKEGNRILKKTIASDNLIKETKQAENREGFAVDLAEMIDKEMLVYGRKTLKDRLSLLRNLVIKFQERTVLVIGKLKHLLTDNEYIAFNGYEIPFLNGLVDLFVQIENKGKESFGEMHAIKMAMRQIIVINANVHRTRDQIAIGLSTLEQVVPLLETLLFKINASIVQGNDGPN